MITHSFGNKFFELKSFDPSLYAPFRPWHIGRPPYWLSLWLPPPWVADTFRNLTTHNLTASNDLMDKAIILIIIIIRFEILLNP